MLTVFISWFDSRGTVSLSEGPLIILIAAYFQRDSRGRNLMITTWVFLNFCYGRSNSCHEASSRGECCGRIGKPDSGGISGGLVGIPGVLLAAMVVSMSSGTMFGVIGFLC